MQALQGKHSKQQCKRHRAKIVTANSKASAIRQTAPQPQPVPLSHRRNSHRGALSTSKCACPGGMNGEVGPRSGHAPSPPLRPVYIADRVYVACAFMLTSRVASPKRRRASRAVCLTQAGGARGRRAWAARAGGAGGRRKRAARARDAAGTSVSASVSGLAKAGAGAGAGDSAVDTSWACGGPPGSPEGPSGSSGCGPEGTSVF